MVHTGTGRPGAAAGPVSPQPSRPRPCEQLARGLALRLLSSALKKPRPIREPDLVNRPPKRGRLVLQRGYDDVSAACCWPGGAARLPRRGGAGRPAQKEPDRSYRMARYEGAALARQPSGWNDVSVQGTTRSPG